ncbi:MAG: ABC transporter ATP-binding protein [Nitrospirae bacterium]|nr:ABC transporter ATP-binding protein [Nitrospirota bacterium]
MIEIKNLSKSYKVGGNVINAVDKVNLSVARREIISILGHSGSGKTTLLSLIGGLTTPSAGTVTIDNVDLWSISDDELSRLRNRKINFIFQFSSLVPTLNVIENVLLPTVFSKDGTDKRPLAGQLLDTLGISDKASMYPSELSGGQQRRVAIARAFINDPEIILADEPTGDLDEETEADVLALFRTMNAEKGITFLIVTHSSEIARQGHKLYVMNHGVLSQKDIA